VRKRKTIQPNSLHNTKAGNKPGALKENRHQPDQKPTTSQHTQKLNLNAETELQIHTTAKQRERKLQQFEEKEPWEEQNKRPQVKPTTRSKKGYQEPLASAKSCKIQFMISKSSLLGLRNRAASSA
jgi:hypothetical protein